MFAGKRSCGDHSKRLSRPIARSKIQRTTAASRTRRMDIDDIIEELRPLVRNRGTLKAADVAKARGLLALPRYVQARDGARDLLLADLKQAVSNLPVGANSREGPGMVRADAEIVLLTRPGDNPKDRFKNLLSCGATSGGAVRWRRNFLLSLVAVELLELQHSDQDRQSYRVLSVHVKVAIIYDGDDQHRPTSFEWHIEPLVSDMRWFGFTHSVGQVPVNEWDAVSQGHKKVGRAPDKGLGEDGDYWYVVSLGKALPKGKPVTIKTEMHAVCARGILRWLSYTLPYPTETLLLTADVPTAEATQFACRELERRDTCAESDHGRDGDATMRYAPPAPRKGRTYRIEWST
jgi:hypothetical protein